jgi:regulator of protease activity HflC (stomatin/prohibitin superfamily)
VSLPPTTILLLFAAIAVIGLIAAAGAVRVVRQYERGVVSRFGRVRDGTRGPGRARAVAL